jgi:hypothetical protein
MQKSTLFPIFWQGDDRSGRLLATASSRQNALAILTEVEGGSGTATQEQRQQRLMGTLLLLQ